MNITLQLVPTSMVTPGATSGLALTLQPALRGDDAVQTAADRAAADTSAQAAKVSETNAKTSETNAKTSETNTAAAEVRVRTMTNLALIGY